MSTIDNEKLTEEVMMEQSQGKRLHNVIVVRQLLPGSNENEQNRFIRENVTEKGKGFQLILGRIEGTAARHERKEFPYQGNMLKSVVCEGKFYTESYLTGEVNDGTMVYLPNVYAEKIAEVFESDPSIDAVNIDCDIGLEATTKGTGYAWIVYAFREGEELAILRHLRKSRGRPRNAPPMLPGYSQPKLDAPIKPELLKGPDVEPSEEDEDEGNV